MINMTNYNTSVLTQFVGESLWDFFIRQGKNPLKFGISKPVSKKRKVVKPNQVSVFKLTDVEVGADMGLFIKSFYKDFENLVSTYKLSTVNTFLLSLISYLNDGKISRRRIYDFVNTFDKEDKIRTMTMELYNYETKFEDWHHVGGAFSHQISSTCTKTESVESNGVDGRMCHIFLAPENLNTYVQDVLGIYITTNVIQLNYTYNVVD